MPTNGNLIIRKIIREQKIGILHVPTDSLEENITGVIMKLPRNLYHPDGQIDTNPIFKVGQEVAVMRGKVGTTMAATHIPADEEFKDDDKSLWMVVPATMVVNIA